MVDGQKVYKIRTKDGKYLVRQWRGANDVGSIFTTLAAAKNKINTVKRHEYVAEGAESRYKDLEIIEYTLVKSEVATELVALANEALAARLDAIEAAVQDALDVVV